MALSLYFLVAFAFYLVIFAAVWVLVNFGLYRMAAHAGIPRAWLTLVPVGNAYVMGLLAERAVYTYTRRTHRLAFWMVILQALPLASLALLTLPLLIGAGGRSLMMLLVLLLSVTAIAGTILNFYALYYIFKDYSPDNALLFFLLGILFNIYWIFLLVEMNNVPVSVTGFGVFPYGRPKYDKYHRWRQGPPPGPGPYTTNPGQSYYPPQDGQSPNNHYNGPEL